MSDFTIEDKVREIRRELALRKRVFPLWVTSGKMKAGQAERLIGIMQAIHDDYMNSKLGELQ